MAASSVVQGMKVGVGAANISVGGFGAGKLYIDQHRRERELLQGAFRKDGARSAAGAYADPDSTLDRLLQTAPTTPGGESALLQADIRSRPQLPSAATAAPRHPALQWAPEEDMLLLEKLAELGNQWSLVRATYFPSKPVEQVQKRGAHLRRLASRFAGVDDDRAVPELLEKELRESYAVCSQVVKDSCESRVTAAQAEGGSPSAMGVSSALNSAAALEARGQMRVSDAAWGSADADARSTASDEASCCSDSEDLYLTSAGGGSSGIGAGEGSSTLSYHSAVSASSSDRAAYTSVGSIFSTAGSHSSLSSAILNAGSPDTPPAAEGFGGGGSGDLSSSGGGTASGTLSATLLRYSAEPPVGCSVAAGAGGALFPQRGAGGVPVAPFVFGGGSLGLPQQGAKAGEGEEGGMGPAAVRPAAPAKAGGGVVRSVEAVAAAAGGGGVGKKPVIVGGGRRRRRRDEDCDFPVPPGSSMRMAETMQWLLMGPTQPAGAPSSPPVPPPQLKRSRLLQSLAKSIPNVATPPGYRMDLMAREQPWDTPNSNAKHPADPRKDASKVWMSALEPYRCLAKSMLGVGEQSWMATVFSPNWCLYRAIWNRAREAPVHVPTPTPRYDAGSLWQFFTYRFSPPFFRDRAV